MRMSQLFSQTLREAPADAEAASHRMLLRAGFIRPLAAGIFSYLPLARRSLTKIESILREEIEAIGGQEITMPVVHPADLWKQSNRWYEIGTEMGRFVDKGERDMVLAMTHEEVVADLVRREIQSYRQLPKLVYQIQTKWRDDPRPRAGLIRAREFTMLDSYSLDRDDTGLDQQYRAHYQAYFNIFYRCGLPTIAVGADVGMMGGSLAHEYIFLSPLGEDTILLCDACGHKANRQIATFRKLEAAPEEPLPIEKVATPDTKTIAALAQLLDIPVAKTAKAVFLVATIAEDQHDIEKLIFAVIRGDMELNETKLANAINAKALRPAEEQEIRAAGAVPGYASSIGVRDVLVVADEAISHSPNLVAGANQEGYHLRHVNYGRDFRASVVADLALAQAGAGCPRCGAALREERGIEVGNIFKLGTHFSIPLEATFVDEEGVAQPVVMGSYGIGVGRLLACIAEAHHDEHGLVWPVTVAPFSVHLVALRGGFETADQLYRQLTLAGMDTLYDDRDESPGVKFNDADLLGMPVRVTVGKRALDQGGVEVKLRHASERELVPLENLVGHVQTLLTKLRSEINQNLREIPFSG